MDPHPYGWLSLLPPVLAIALAMLTRRVIVSLLAGVLAGALITTGGLPLAAVGEALELHLWKTLIQEDKLRIFAFTLLMGAMVGVVSRSGGMRGLVEAVSPFAKTRRRGQLVTWLLGLLIFFDDYANTVLLGNTLRPLCDRLRISREKLAYLVDSTAAPVAGLALVSTWVAGEISFVQDGLNKLPAGHGLQAVPLFVASIPYRFYVLWSLFFVALVSVMNRDFAAMRAAEQKALARRDDEDAAVHDPLQLERPIEPEAQTPARWYNAVVPIAMTVAAILWLLYASGRAAILAERPDARPSMMEIFGQADAFYALVWGSLAGLATAALLVWVQGLLSGRQIRAAAAAGAAMMLPALAILWLASTLSIMTGDAALPGDEPPAVEAAAAGEPAAAQAEVEPTPHEHAAPYRYRLYTGQYLSGLVGDRLAAPLLPTIVFLLAAGISFATGTSWGTMGVLMPLAIPLTYGAIAGATGPAGVAAHPVLLATIGSVLAGAIFGDHCSPISDTTVLSSQASGCNHMAHVWTQLPYALTVGAVTILCGTLPAGYGVSVWPLSILGCLALAAVLWLVGRPAEGADTP